MTHQGRTATPRRITLADRIRGCLLGGHLGDALGAGIEFRSLEGIRERYGPAGVTGLTGGYGVLAPLTDDTQMTLFTAEGLLDAHAAIGPVFGRDVDGTPAYVYRAHLRWLATQGRRTPPPGATGLAAEKVLYATRAPGGACLSGLAARGMGTLAAPKNPNSKGCGTVMRSAPFGLTGSFRRATGLAAECAAQTHGHPTAIEATRVFAGIIADLAGGWELRQAADVAADDAVGETQEILARAVALAAQAEYGPSAEDVEELGEGWVAEEALAIALYCALACDGDVAAGLLVAVNHSGDSDSTGAICGNLLGAAYGLGALPAAWLGELEGLDLVLRVADQMVSAFGRP